MPGLAGFFEDVDVFLAQRNIGMDGVVFVDELREAEGTGHAGGAAAYDDDVGLHGGAAGDFERFSENKHGVRYGGWRPIMINANRSLVQRIRYRKLFADADRGRILNLAMPGDGAGSLRRWILVNGVFSALAHQHNREIPGGG